MSTSTIHWNIGSDLGIYRVSNNYNISLRVEDPDPSLGPVTYNLLTGTLPPSLQLDTDTGYLWGFAEYQIDYIKNYNFSIEATKSYTTGTSLSIVNTFTLTIKGFLDSNIEWVTTSTLQSIETGYPSTLQLEAKETINNFETLYRIVDGNLPNGLDLNNDGSISGQVDYGSTGTYTFTVLASNDYDIIGVSQEFDLTVTESTSTQYTKIYCKPFLSKEKRTQYQNFINDASIFDPEDIYRYLDSNFGVQSNLKMILDFGIERIPLDQYTQALRQNFYKRRFTLSEPKVAVAKDDSGTILYEIIYLDVIDNLRTATLTLYSNRDVSESLSGGSAGQIIYGDNTAREDNIYYPASVNNMRIQLSRIQLDDWSIIKVNRLLEPQFLKTSQSDDQLPTNYIPFVALCYVKPGKSRLILKKIKAKKFSFNTLDFEIDRIVVQNSQDYSSDKYLLFGRENITDTLATDVTLYQGDIFWQFDDGVQLTRT